MSVDKIYAEIVSCLVAAERATKFAYWRKRFSACHSDSARAEAELENENYMKIATIEFYKAKSFYVQNRDTIDQFLKTITELNEYDKEEAELVHAMKRVIKNEIEEEIENLLLGEEEVEFEELDEDEQYVRETECTSGDDAPEWDGDEYIGKDEEDSFENEEDEKY